MKIFAKILLALLALTVCETHLVHGQTGVRAKNAGAPKADQTSPAIDLTSDDPGVAYSATYNRPSRQCKNDDAIMGDGDDFGQLCKGYGGYSLVLTGFEYKTNFAVRDANGEYNEYLRAVQGGPAEKFDTGEYVSRLGDRIKWMLDKNRPFAFSVHVIYYKDRGNAKTSFDPKNKVAEFVLVRGLKGYESLKHDLDAEDAAYNVDEQDQYLAFRLLEKLNK